jgi:hypothetical protein
VPVGAIADLWLEYYWQLFESPRFLPQAGGEAKAGVHKLAFAQQLDALRAHFAGTGGLPGLLSSWRQGSLDPAGTKLLHALQRKLKSTIRDQPVQYAGVSTSGALFGFERGHVLVPGELWQEISLMSHWVRDSLLVRWADLVARFAAAAPSSGSARSGSLVAGSASSGSPASRSQAGRGKGGVREHALGILLEPALDGRQTAHARQVYASLPEKHCAWSGRPLRQTFDVDHIIPFSLWHSNDLWNLVPAAKAVNNQKRDRLPTRRLLRDRRPIILDCWHQLDAQLHRRFEAELWHLTGDEGASYEAGFDALVEAVETTALQRGVERWAGAS